MALVAAFRGLRRNAALLDRSGMFVDQVRSISKQKNICSSSLGKGGDEVATLQGKH
jgi:hypothetical protein